jgi:hypothetical protein
MFLSTAYPPARNGGGGPAIPDLTRKVQGALGASLRVAGGKKSAVAELVEDGAVLGLGRNDRFQPL